MVLAIITILGAIAAPRWSEAMGRYRVEAAARRIVADVAMAQTSARAASAARTVTFNPTIDHYRISNMKNFETNAGSYTVELDEPPYLADLASTDFTLATPLSFNAFGVPNMGGMLAVSSGGFSLTIIIDADSGIATIQ